MNKVPKIPQHLLDGIPPELQKHMISAFHIGFERGMFQVVKDLGIQVNDIAHHQNKAIRSLKNRT